MYSYVCDFFLSLCLWDSSVAMYYCCNFPLSLLYNMTFYDYITMYFSIYPWISIWERLKRSHICILLPHQVCRSMAVVRQISIGPMVLWLSVTKPAIKQSWYTGLFWQWRMGKRGGAESVKDTSRTWRARLSYMIHYNV